MSGLRLGLNPVALFLLTSSWLLGVGLVQMQEVVQVVLLPCHNCPFCLQLLMPLLWVRGEAGLEMHLLLKEQTGQILFLEV
jgi:hypothetical protein